MTVTDKQSYGQQSGNDRRGLLIVRAGDKSLHPAWLTGRGAAHRNWDLHLSYYGAGQPSEIVKGTDITLTRDNEQTFRGNAECLDKIEGRLANYDYIGFIDDDLFARCSTWNNFIEILLKYRPKVAQPAVHRASFYTYLPLLQNPQYILRWTNFVEVMMPFFSRDALAVARPTFRETKSSWGIDLIWPTFFAPESRSICVVDSTPVLHTRRVQSGDLYKSWKDSGAPDPRQEMADALAKYKIDRPAIRTYGGVLASGKMTAETDSKAFERHPSFVTRLRSKVRDRLDINSVNPAFPVLL